MPEKSEHSQKYDSGHALIYGADALTGATRLAATACARMGLGLVSVLCNADIADVYRTSLPAHIMVREDFEWSHKSVSVKLYGPGGVPIAPNFESSIPTILDADAMMDLPKEGLAANYILTPHEGEFMRAFPNIKGDRIERAIQAAQQSRAHIILKGSETIIAGPKGNYVINRHASPHLATAGTGDLLAGMIAGLAGQEMDTFHACCAATWIHGECARVFGKGLVAEDLPHLIPSVLQKL